MSEKKTENDKKGAEPAPYDPIRETGAVLTDSGRGKIECLTVIGQIEGHYLLGDNAKTTKYEHVIPLLAAVEESAEVLSEVIGNLFVGLDCRKIIISGRVIRLGETYLNKLRVGLRRQDYCVEFSGLNGNGPIMGAIFEAVNIALDVVIARRLNTRNR